MMGAIWSAMAKSMTFTSILKTGRELQYLATMKSRIAFAN
jgi:hypothetical protein